MELYPPPPASEGSIPDRPPSQSNITHSQIKRKPIPAKLDEVTMFKKKNRQAVVVGGNPEELAATSPALSPRPELSLQTNVPQNITDAQVYSSPGLTRSSGGGTSTTSSLEPASTTSLHPPSHGSSISIPESITPVSPQSSTSFITKAFQETRHFAGGLVSHPSESTKHYTILRHSQGLVFYQGSKTSLAISIFSDAPLPDDRTFWLQSKGWSGRTGMMAKAFIGINGNWLDVTPTTAVTTEQLNPQDDRAWQRDIAKFRKKGPKKIREKHVIRETAVVRIPAEAGDGYFQVVMCSGDKKKVLCPSPTFRLFSTSTSPSSLRGASLSALPLELAARIGSLALTSYVTTTAGAVVAPVTLAVQSSVGKYMPSFWTKKALEVGYGVAEETAAGVIEGRITRAEQSEAEMLASARAMEATLEEGPSPPYPITLKGSTQIGVTNMAEELSKPVFSLIGADTNVVLKLDGYYFGWASPNDKSKKDDPSWCEAIISILPLDITQLPRAKVAHTNKKTITIRLLNDFDDPPAHNTHYQLQILGFIRPDEPSQRLNMEIGLREGDEAAHEAAMLTEVNDMQMAREFLDHPSWAPDRPGLEERKSSGLQRLAEGVRDTRAKAMRGVDRVPLHKLGVRLESDKAKDKAVIASGFFVVR